MTERVDLYTAAQVQAAERPLLEAGVPLMARASRALAALVAAERPHRVLVLAGAGDNGGDALFAAAHLAAQGAAVDVILTAPKHHEAGLASAIAAGAHVTDAAAAVARTYEVVFDGILGIGASGPLRGHPREVVHSLRSSLSPATRVVAVDLPSGLGPDDGSADSEVLPAVLTVTFGAVKAGLARGRGPALAGTVVLVDIGLDLSGVAPLGTATIDRIIRG